MDEWGDGESEWGKMEEGYAKQQEIAEKMKGGANLEQWRIEQNAKHDACIKRHQKEQEVETQEEPTGWWYIPPATDTPENEQQDKEQLDLTESETEHEELFTTRE